MTKPNLAHRWIPLPQKVFLWCFLAGVPALAAAPETLVRAKGEISEVRLLDVNIQILDPGIDPENPQAAEDKGVFPEVRKAEARMIPLRLMETMQSTGYWGAVRVVPQADLDGELAVSGTILRSSGLKLVVRISARDAAGRIWFERKFKEEADPRAYLDRATGGVVHLPFQNLYNRIANRLLLEKQRMQVKKLVAIREVAKLKFAQGFVPDAFDDYLKQKRPGRFKIKKLPSPEDPMVVRLAMIRERDRMFVDTLTQHYQNFGLQIDEAYHNWRKSSFEEEVELRKLRRKARGQQILGALLMVGAILADGNDDGTRVARQAAVIGGDLALRQGIAKGQEAKIHREALKELAESFDAEVAPILVEVEGHQHRLAGSVETQYETWRGLLKEIFLAETGVVLDPNQGTPQARAGGEN